MAKREWNGGENGMWMIWESGRRSLREIGELFGGLDYTAVAQRIRRNRLAHNARTRRKLLKEMLNIEIRPPISFHAWRGNMIETHEQAGEFEEP